MLTAAVKKAGTLLTMVDDLYARAKELSKTNTDNVRKLDQAKKQAKEAELLADKANKVCLIYGGVAIEYMVDQYLSTL